MSSLIPSGGASGTGSVTLLAPNTNSNQTQTLPDATGTVMVSGNMPAFSAYATSGQTLSAGSTTKILFPTELFDTNNNFASSTFTPTVAGYYQLNTNVSVSGGVTNQALLSFYKNGSAYKHLTDSNSSTYGLIGSALVYANGTTDYFDVYVYTANGFSTSGSQAYIWFDGAMVRSA